MENFLYDYLPVLIAALLLPIPMFLAQRKGRSALARFLLALRVSVKTAEMVDRFRPEHASAHKHLYLKLHCNCWKCLAKSGKSKRQAKAVGNFANAREVRKLFEMALENQALRGMEDGKVEKEELSTFIVSDIN